MSPTNSPPKAVIFGCEGLTLTEWEQAFFADVNPLGFILFARNVESPLQVRALTQSLRATVGRDDAPILIDQEGGRVQRLRPPHWTQHPPVMEVSDCPDEAEAAKAVSSLCTSLAGDLMALGIDVDCAPLLDVPVPGAHDVIGDRAFHGDASRIGRLGRQSCRAFLDGGVLPVIKHIPGHGRAMSDSHKDLPRVSASRAELEAEDFLPFITCQDAPWAMTAHIVYEALDAERPATLSPTVISEIIRGQLGFDGLLLTDDLSMHALTGPFEERAEASLKAGCDVVLHCNGDPEEMAAVAKGTKVMGEASLARLAKGRAMLDDPSLFPITR